MGGNGSSRSGSSNSRKKVTKVTLQPPADRRRQNAKGVRSAAQPAASEFIHNLQQQIYFLEMETQYLRSQQDGSVAPPQATVDDQTATAAAPAAVAAAVAAEAAWIAGTATVIVHAAVAEEAARM